MQTKRFIVVFTVLLASLALTGGVLAGTQMVKGDVTSGRLASLPPDARLAIISEETGLIAADTPLSSECQFDPSYGVYLCPPPKPQVVTASDPAARRHAQAVLATRGLLLIPDSTNDRVMAFDPATGDLIEADFIPSDPTHLFTPVNAIFEPRSNTILVSDQVNDVVQHYDLDGNYLGIFAPSTGISTTIMDNIRGIALRPNGQLLVSVAVSANADSVIVFTPSGEYLGQFIPTGSGGLASPWDIYWQQADWLVSGIDSDAVHRYDLYGTYIANLTSVDNFPEQIAETPGGNVLVADFSGTQEGVLEYTADGTFIGRYNPAALGGYRGVYELPNGNILTTNSTGVHEIDRAGNLVETKISGISAHLIEYVSLVDLEVGLTDTPDPVQTGGLITYTVTITNNGIFTATGIVLTDTLPEYSGLARVLPDTLTCSGSAGVVTCTVGTLLPGEMTIASVVITPSISGSRFNQVDVQSDVPDTLPEDNVASVQTLVIADAIPHACGHPANPLVNCGFETLDFTGWITHDLSSPYFPLMVTGTGVTILDMPAFSSDPTEGDYAALTGFDGDGPGVIRLAQDIWLPEGASNLLFDYRAAWDLIDFAPTGVESRLFSVHIEPFGGGAPLQSTPILIASAHTVITDTGNLSGLVDVSAFAGGPVRVAFEWVVPQDYTGPGLFQLDNVVVQLPAIAVDPTAMTSAIHQDQIITQTLVISDVGPAPLHWSLPDASSLIKTLLPTHSLTLLYNPPSSTAPAIDVSSGEEGQSAEPLAVASVAVYSPPANVLYDNGSLVNSPGTGAGGADESIVQTSLGMNTYGFGDRVALGERIADDFTITNPQGWYVNSIIYFTYQTNSPLISPLTETNYLIWDGPPDDPTSQIVYGDPSTNRLGNSTWTGVYRVNEAGSGTAINRPIMANTVGADVFLPPGTYWLDWQADGTSGLSGPWAPPIVITGEVATGNALQYSGGVWHSADDGGTGETQDFPFFLVGCTSLPWLTTTPVSGTTAPGTASVATLTFDATGLATGTYTGTLCVASDDPLHNVIAVPLTMTVASAVDLTLVKAAQPNPVTIGGTLTYTLAITNHGPATATMVILTDTLPAEVTYLSVTPDQGTCSQVGGLVTCDLGDIASGGAVSIQIVVIAPSDPITITNTAEVTALEFDLFPDDNTAILPILVKSYNLFLPIVIKP